MIDFHTRKPIADFLNKVTEPHQPLTREEQKDFFEAIIGIYEESTSDRRTDFLKTDVFDLLRVYVMEDKAIDRTNPNDTHRLKMMEVEWMIIGLVSGAAQVGVYLPKSEIERYKDVDFTIGSFAEFVSDIYTPAKPTDNQTGNMPGKGADEPQSGNETTTRSTAKKPKPTFRDLVIDSKNADETIRKLHELVGERRDKDFVLIIRAAIRRGLILKPTHPQILKEFGEVCKKQTYSRYMNNVVNEEEINAIVRLF